MNTPHLRIARPVTSLTQSETLYCTGLGLEVTGRFDEHNGFSGIMLSYPQAAWHLEFTLCHRHPITPAPGSEDLLVLYYPDPTCWRQRCEKMRLAGFHAINSYNPYWDHHGQTFIDNDGYRTVIQQSQWPVTPSEPAASQTAV